MRPMYASGTQYIAANDAMNTADIIILFILDVLVAVQVKQCAGVGDEGGVCRTIVSRQANRRSDAPCVFPFIYKGVTYTGCTNVEDKRGRFWCSTKVDGNYRHVKGEAEFGYCEKGCAKDPKGTKKKDVECLTIEVEDSYSNYSTGIYTALDETVVAWAPHLPVWERAEGKKLYIFWLSNVAGWVIGQRDGLQDGVHFYKSGVNSDSPWKVEDWTQEHVSVKCIKKIDPTTAAPITAAPTTAAPIIQKVSKSTTVTSTTTTSATSTTKSPSTEYEREQIWSIVNNGISTSTQKLEVTSPFFISKPGNYRTQLGGRVTFVCEVGNLGSNAVIWKKDDHILTAASIIIRKDKRFSLDGYNLSLKDVARRDAGKYVCVVETLTSPLVQISHLQVLVPPTVQPHIPNGNRGTSKSASSECRTEETKNTQLKSNALCQFPFRHKNVTYVGCTSDEDHASKPWCSTKVDQEGNHVAKQGEYGHCRENCPMFIPGIVDEGVKKCEEGRICRRRVDCPEINKRVLKLQGKRKNGVNVTEELKQLKSMVCNRHPKAFCCPT